MQRAPKPVLQATALALCAVLSLALGGQTAGAQESVARLSSQGYSRDFDGRAVNTSIAIAGGGSLVPGGRYTLQLDIDTLVEADDGPHEARGAVINGLLQLALPPGLEPDGKLRLSYFDSGKGSYQFMYSRDYPKLERLSGLEAAFAAAGGNDPESIFGGLSSIGLALDPGLKASPPSDSRIAGQDASYAVTGITWLLPCNVLHKPVVDPFDPEASLEANAKIRASIPLKCTAEVNQPVAVYVGGLSCAVVETELAADKLPPTAIPLVPLPEPPPAPPAAAEAEDKPAGTDSTAEGQNSDEVQRPRASGDADKPPPPSGARPAGADAAAAPGPPPIVPVLTFSYAWLAWETEISPAQLAGYGQDGSQGTLSPRNPADSALIPPPDVSLAGIDEDSGGETPPGESVDIPAIAVQPRLNRDKPQAAVEEPASAADSEDSVAEQPQEEASGSAEVPAGSSNGAREVKLGTLPDEPEVYRVPLKPITGSGAGSDGAGRPEFGSGSPDGADAGFIPDGRPAGQLPPRGASGPADIGEMILIPAGEFLMGTGGNASAGDADEMPQEKVLLPDYYIDKYPVSNRQFYDFVLSAGYKPEGNWDKYYSPVSADEPVRAVTWNDAAAYAKWARKRLPTEAEWEKAARGEDGRTYPWGEEWSSELLPREENLLRVMTAPGTASPYGVMGMVGVVWQWTASAYSSSYPFNPNATSDKRVLRGGAYSNGRNIVRCANRYAEAPNVPLNTFGFRCVKDK